VVAVPSQRTVFNGLESAALMSVCIAGSIARGHATGVMFKGPTAAVNLDVPWSPKRDVPHNRMFDGPAMALAIVPKLLRKPSWRLAPRA
jgi:hypothetical protein